MKILHINLTNVSNNQYTADVTICTGLIFYSYKVVSCWKLNNEMSCNLRSLFSHSLYNGPIHEAVQAEIKSKHNIDYANK